MKKSKRIKIGILIWIYLYFSIQLVKIDLSINSISIVNRNITPNLSIGKSFSIEWNRTWGGDSWDVGAGVMVDLSDNVYVTGYTVSFGVGGRDMVLVKYDGDSKQLWNGTWGGGDEDEGIGVAVDTSDNVYIAGYTESFGAGSIDMVLVKYDGDGVQQWNQTWGGDDNDFGYGVTVDLSNNIYIAGDTYNFGAGFDDMVLVKYDGDGVQQWNQTWGGDGIDFATEVASDYLNNVYIVGGTESFGAGDASMVLVKYDENGVPLWNRTWGGDGIDFATEVAIDYSNNVYIVGRTESFGAGGADMVLVKWDENGVQQWNRTWGGISDDVAYGVSVDSSYNVYLSGTTYSFGAGDADMVLVKYDENGVKQWNCTWGGSNWDGDSHVAVDSLDNVYLSGTTYSFGAGDDDMVLVKYSNLKQLPSDELILMIIIVLSIMSVVGLGIVITYFSRKRRKIVE